ncbi:hypothetical protein POV27_14760 [Aureisphaera galaxeae]|uniref:hypothetical protein n=1 Tax=Aureisphaera galaxeae TaxID=1538023 RepID=UPI0023501DEC|nr:hypothetical protein [Aureisphaera galaxeae]MDC8005321.1 hypothetical protein [Aureisphaera galaxeae]
MSNTKLFFISIGIIALLAGVPHITANLSYANTTEIVETPKEKIISEVTEAEPFEEEETINESPFLGKWRASFNYDGTMGYMIVRITSKKGKMVGHIIAYEDDLGNSEGAKDLVLQFKKEKKSGWSAIYTTEYENETYQIPCTVKLLSPSQLQLSYDYYGFSDIETWTKEK